MAGLPPPRDAGSVRLVQRHPDIDAYIAARSPAIRAVLDRVRAAVHRARPGIEEALKWRTPFFAIDGRPVLMMAGFKHHASFGLWRMTGEPPPSPLDRWDKVRDEAELPDEAALAEAIAAALRIAAEQPPAPPRRSAPVLPLAVPPDLAAALATHDAATTAFAGFPPSARNDYVAWLDEAKRPATRASRLATALGWIAEGKRRNWRYER